MSTEAWKLGNEFLPFHPQASHIAPDYRDGWNHCHAAALAELAALRERAERAEKDAAAIAAGFVEALVDAERYRWLRRNDSAAAVIIGDYAAELLNLHLPAGDALDAAIDAELAGSQKGVG